MSDLSKINFSGTEYNIKDATARTEVAKKVTAAGGDLSNTKIVTADNITTDFPVPAANDTAKGFLGKMKKFCTDFNSFKTGVITLGKLVNNGQCTEAGYALDARMGKTLGDQVAQLNTDLTNVVGYTQVDDANKAVKFGRYRVSGSGANIPSWGGGVDLLVVPYENGVKAQVAIFNSQNPKLAVRAMSSGTYGNWIEYAQKDDLPIFCTITVNPDGKNYVDISIAGIQTSWAPQVINSDTNFWSGYVKGLVVQNGTIHVLLSEARSGSIRLGISYKKP